MPLMMKSGSFNRHVSLTPEEGKARLDEVRSSLGTLTAEGCQFCSDACLIRYLKANNWNQKKAKKMVLETLKWREQYRPDQIKFEEVAKEAETGKIYTANFRDKDGRTVLVMRPGVENTNELSGQMRYLVYCMETAIAKLPPDQEQLVWLVDFEGWSMSTVPIKTARETALVLQNHYPERLAYAILFNPPKIFEMFWNVVRPFLDPTTQKKVRFLHTKDDESHKVMETMFDIDKLESGFGGGSSSKSRIGNCASKTDDSDKECHGIPLQMTTFTSNNDSLSTIASTETRLNGHVSPVRS